MTALQVLHRPRAENRHPVTYRCLKGCHWQIPVFFLLLPFLQWLCLTNRRVKGMGMTENMDTTTPSISLVGKTKQNTNNPIRKITQ